jgi:hypothetical protein
MFHRPQSLCSPPLQPRWAPERERHFHRVIHPCIDNFHSDARDSVNCGWLSDTVQYRSHFVMLLYMILQHMRHFCLMYTDPRLVCLSMFGGMGSHSRVLCLPSDPAP